MVCPVTADSDVAGIAIFSTDAEETKRIMEGDPAVQAGVVLYESQACRGFPGDALPK